MRFLFCSLDSIGFLFPAIGIAKALSARGHEVAFVTDAKHIERLAALGLQRIPRGETDGGSFQVQRWYDPISVAIQVKHIEYAMDRFAPDVLVGQTLTLGPLLVAERRRIPLGVLGFCAYLWPIEDEIRGRSLEERRLRWRYGDMMQILNRARALFSLPPCSAAYSETPLLGDLFLQRNVPELVPEADRYPGRVHFVGSCLWEPPSHDEEVEDWLGIAKRSKAPIIYVHHGKFFHIPAFWDALVEALTKLGIQVAASVGQMGHSVGVVPPSFFVRAHTPQTPVLRHARLLVAGGNSTAFLGALEAGVPSLLIPAGGEQEEVAELARRAGIAHVLNPEELTSEQIQEQVTELLSNPVYAERAEQYRKVFASIRGSEKAADLLERLAVVKGPIFRAETVVQSFSGLEAEQSMTSQAQFVG